MVEVENALLGLEQVGSDVSHFQSYVPLWWRAVIAPDVPWQQSAASEEPALENDHRNMLLALASVIDMVPGLPRAPTEESGEKLSALMNEVRQLLEEETDLVAHIRAGVSGLVSQIQVMLEQPQAYAPEQIQTLLDQLSGTMMRAATAAKDPERKKRWAGLGVAVAEGLGTNALYDAVKGLTFVGLSMMGIETGS